MKKINVISWAVVSVFAAAFMTSCNKQEDGFTKLDGRYVYFNVDTENDVDTKAVNSIQKSETFEISGNGVSLFITASKSINDDNPFKKGLATKGVEKTDADISEGFEMRMFADANNSLYKTGIVKQQSADGSYWSFWDGADKVVWPDEAENGATYSFVSVIGAENMTFANYAAKTVDYTGMVHQAGAVNDAEIIEDLLVAYTKGVQHDHSAQNPVNLRFYHPLAAVRFYVSTKVKQITVTNVRQGGTITYNAVNPSDADDFKKVFNWTSSAEDSNITNYTQNVKASDVDETTGYAAYEFFLIPQQFDSQDVMLTFTVEAADGKVHQITTLANNLGTGSWDAGYRYNYYIDETASGNVGVQIKENFQNYVKSNVTVFNTKRSTAYVRATVVANWESESGKIIAPFKGTINYNTGAGSNWVLGDDGYYYYTKPVVGFTYTEPLISSFSDTSTSAELNFKLRKYRLVWRIIAQGVEFDQDKQYVGEAWSSITVGGQSLVGNILTTE